MKIFRHILVLCSCILTSTATSGKDSVPSIDSDLEEVRLQLVERLSPFEAELLERINKIEDKQKKEDPWLQPPIVLAFVIAVAGWVIAIFQFFGNRGQRTWELLLESLRWFEGGTQPRSIGIALVESKWAFHPEFRGRWASILVNQAIYLLTRKNDRDAIHERANLYRIMDLLINKVDQSGLIGKIEHQLLSESLSKYDPKSDRGLIDLDHKIFESWKKHFKVNVQKSA